MSTGTSIETTQDHTSALKLWRAVISQALIDAASEKKHFKIPVAKWLLTDDFEIVCGLARLNEHTIRRITAEILREHPIRAQILCKRLIDEIEEL